MENIEDINKYYLINWNTTFSFDNKKVSGLINEIKNDKRFIFIEDNIENIKIFITKNRHKKYILIFPIYTAEKKKELNNKLFLKSRINFVNFQFNLVKFINQQNNLKIKIIISLADIYNGLKERTKQNRELYSSDFIYILSGPNLDTFKDYIYNFNEQNNLSLLKKNNLLKRTFHFSSLYSYCYFYNKIPINKIILSGKLLEQYPERIKFNNLKNKNIEILKYDLSYRVKNKCDEYVKLLSNYICAFVSFATKPRFKWGIIHKIYEVLSAGCLLLCPINHEKSLKEIGLINNENYMLIDFNNNPNEKINFICDKTNKKLIDNIRKKGFELAKNKLNAKNKFEELLNVIKKIE